jgi:hypothetical protein
MSKDLFGDAIESKKKVNQTVYYLSVSAMQKCIRRGETERAVNFARVAYGQQSYRAFCRLWTILFEDCGTSLEALQAFREYPIGSKEFEPLIPLVIAMAECVKDYNQVYVSDLVQGACYGKSLPPVALYHALKDTDHAPLVEWYKAWPERKLDIFDLLDYDSSNEWIPTLCKLGCKFDRSNFAIGVPYLLCSGVSSVLRIRSRDVSTTLYRDFFPLEAADIHTRQGKFAYSVFLKNHWKHGSIKRDEMGEFVFYHEGVVHDREYVRSFNLRQMVWDLVSSHEEIAYLADMFDPPQVERWESALPQVNKLRAWVLDNHYSEDMDIFQSEYEKDFIDVSGKEAPAISGG